MLMPYTMSLKIEIRLPNPLSRKTAAPHLANTAFFLKCEIIKKESRQSRHFHSVCAGPPFDRIEIPIDVPHVKYEQLQMNGLENHPPEFGKESSQRTTGKGIDSVNH